MNGESDDPFALDADPGVPVVTTPRSFALRMTRRAAVVLPMLATAGCATHRLACESKPADPKACRHRFCRYYRGDAD